MSPQYLVIVTLACLHVVCLMSFGYKFVALERDAPDPSNSGPDPSSPCTFTLLRDMQIIAPILILGFEIVLDLLFMTIKFVDSVTS